MTFLIIMTSICFIMGLLIVYRNLEKEKTKISFKEGLDLTELPIVTFYHKELKLHFLLDTGSNISYIDSNLLSKLDADKSNKKSKTIGAGSSNIDTHHYFIEISYKNQVFREEFGAIDLSEAFNSLEAESGIRLHGILGSNFFEKYKYILDFKELAAYR